MNDDLGSMPASGEIDPELVPTTKLASGASMPAIGLGTFGSDHVSHTAVADAVVSAVRLGYRHIDCASVYGNEDLIGEAFRTLRRTGMARDDLWVSSKVWNDSHGDVAASHQLANLRAVVELSLSEAEMSRLADIDRNCRLIKGQVFLWKEDQSWEDLWDLDGLIAT